MKKIFGNKQRILNTLKILLILFVLFNSLIVAKVLIFDVYNRPYAQARTCMFLAGEINDIYIFPLSVFGLKNPLTWPFYAVRDGLFKLGENLYPKGEGEKEIWWTNIYFNEYKTIIEERFFDYSIWEHQDNFFKKIEADILKKWPNEMYQHLEPLAFAKISTTDIGTESKYYRFLLVSFANIRNKSTLINVLHTEKGDHGPLTLTNQEQKGFENIYLINEKYKKFAKKNETKILDYVMKDPAKKIYDNILQFKVADFILLSRYRNNELSCSDPYIKVFTDNHKQMLYYLEHYPQQDRTVDATIGYHSDQVDMARMCQANPVLKDYIKYVEQGMGMSINTPWLVDGYNKRRHKK